MSRIILALLLISGFAAGCGDRFDHLEPEEAVQQAQEALETGDVRLTLGLLKSAADRGHLLALEYLADAYDRGYLHHQDTDRPATQNLTFRKWPWEAAHWHRAFATELESRVAAGDAEALIMHAIRLRARTFRGGDWHDPAASALEESNTILRDLAASGNATAMIQLGFYSEAGDRHAWFRRAEEAGDPNGCWFQFLFIDSGAHVVTAAEFADAIDRSEECHAMDPNHRFDFAGDKLGSLRAQMEQGNEHASTHLDSLRALGVFDRHPRLRELL